MLKTQALVGAGRFELPTPCAQGIEIVSGSKATTSRDFNEMACDRLQSKNLHVVDSVAGSFLAVQHFDLQ